MISKWAAKVGLAAVMLGAVTAAGADTPPSKVMAYASTYVSGDMGTYVASSWAYYYGTTEILVLAMYDSSGRKVLDVHTYVGAPYWLDSNHSGVVFNGTGTWNNSPVSVSITFTRNTSKPFQGGLAITVQWPSNSSTTFTRPSNSMGVVFVGAS